MSTIHLQIALEATPLPSQMELEEWVNTALTDINKSKEITIRIVDERESARLNELYRGKKGPTNILSFPFEKITADAPDILGDLVICAPVVKQEAYDQKKIIMAHWAHMVIHGILHLQGYDHTSEDDAVIMETLEMKLLQQLGFENPYEEKHHVN